jgi:RNA polymerase sigma factor for flagellar operon FliA
MTHRAAAKYATEAPSDSTLIARHGALIDRIARKLASRTGGAVSADDLWSAGALGLLDAARRFEAERDVKFETFAAHRIKGAMLDEMRRLDHLPRRLREQADKVEQARSRLSHSLQREPTSEELAAATGLEYEELASIQSVTQPAFTMLDHLESPTVPSDEQVEHRELVRAMTQAIGQLPERLQLVLSLHYVEGLTYREIAKILDVSEPRVCQIHGEAMGLLKAAMGER